MLAAWLIWLARGILAPFVAAAVLAYLLEPAVRFVERLGLSRGPAIALVYLALFGGAGLLLWSVLPGAIAELLRFGQQLPGLLQAVDRLARQAQRSYGDLAALAGLQGMVRATLDAVGRLASDMTGAAARIVLALPKALLTAVIAPLLGYYLLKDGRRMAGSLPRALPPSWRTDLWRLGTRLEEVVGGFLRGQLVVAAIVGLLVGCIASWLGLPYAALIGIVAGLFDVIPYFGPIIGALPAVAFALAISPLKAVQVVIALLLVQQLENVVIGPHVLGGRVGLHPLTVILVTLFGGQQAGLAGMLLAVPLTAALKVAAGFACEKLLDWRERLDDR